MCRNIDDIIRSRHDRNISLFIDHPCVASIEPFTIKTLEVALIETFFVFPQRSEGCRCEGNRHDDVSHGASFHFLSGVVDHSDIESGHCFSGRTRFDGQRFVAFSAGEIQTGSGALGYARDGTSAFRGPPVVYDYGAGSTVFAEEFLVHLDDTGF